MRSRTERTVTGQPSRLAFMLGMTAVLLTSTGIAACGQTAARPHHVAATITGLPAKTTSESATGNARSTDAAFRKKLAKFAACLQQHGASVPMSHTSSGPDLELDKINTSGARFKALWTRCRDVVGGTLFHDPIHSRRSEARGTAP